jgi:hypothetical protein
MALPAIATYERQPPGVVPLFMLALMMSLNSIRLGNQRYFLLIVEAASWVIGHDTLLRRL